MSTRENEELDRQLAARIGDLFDASQRGEVAVSDFLTPRELRVAERCVRSLGAKYFAYGGYPDAERCRLYILPDYMDGADLSFMMLADYGYGTSVSVLRIIGSGYRVFTHRDILGSLLGLGIERSVLGDLLILGDEGREAIVLCDEVISDFILKELTHVANDKVRVVRQGDGEWEVPVKKTRPINDTVASARIDAVVAALCDLSREKAREAVVSGLVEIDFESEERPDRAVNAPSVISVRGVGRFKVLSLSDKTKKGRYRLVAEKYV